MGTITLSDRQQRRAEILARIGRHEEGLSMGEAARLLGVTERQVRRQRARYRKHGLASVIHANTGRQPANKTPATVHEKLRELVGVRQSADDTTGDTTGGTTDATTQVRGRYHDFNTCHLQELLAEREGIVIGRSTLDRLLVEEGLRKRSRSRPRRARGRRERCAQQGQMLLTDGSQHDWLEGRDARYPRMCLLGAIDDATGNIVHLHLWPTERQAGYIRMAREVTREHGVPMSFYHDRHTILCSPKEPTIDDELAGREPMSQWQAILSLLGAEPIKAMSPQAKGRIERLWGTLQDRLVKEMRLAGIWTLEEANAFLPGFIVRYNARFGVQARDPEPAWVLADDLDEPFYFAAKEERVVRADHTLSFKGQTLQIERSRAERSLAGTRVMVHATPEGEVFVYADRQRLAYRQVATPAPRIAPAAPAPAPRRSDCTPEQRQRARQRQMAHLHAFAAT